MVKIISIEGAKIAYIVVRILDLGTYVYVSSRYIIFGT